MFEYLQKEGQKNCYTNYIIHHLDDYNHTVFTLTKQFSTIEFIIETYFAAVKNRASNQTPVNSYTYQKSNLESLGDLLDHSLKRKDNLHRQNINSKLNLQVYIEYCRNFKFEENPDYDYLKGLLLDALKEEFANDDKFNFVDENSEETQRSRKRKL